MLGREAISCAGTHAASGRSDPTHLPINPGGGMPCELGHHEGPNTSSGQGNANTDLLVVPRVGESEWSVKEVTGGSAST